MKFYSTIWTKLFIDWQLKKYDRTISDEHNVPACPLFEPGHTISYITYKLGIVFCDQTPKSTDYSAYFNASTEEAANIKQLTLGLTDSVFALN